jgi:dTDP-4-amino-4,6-dideoxygalactose transaminase
MLLVVEDLLKLGSGIGSWKKRKGNLSDASSLAFIPGKNKVLGDAGAITTNDAALAEC